jgi:hypothetical protein
MQEQDLAHVWPTRYGHVNAHVKYPFNVEEVWAQQGLQPLRQPGSTFYCALGSSKPVIWMRSSVNPSTGFDVKSSNASGC